MEKRKLSITRISTIPMTALKENPYNNNSNKKKV